MQELCTKSIKNLCTFNSFKYLFLSLGDRASNPHSFADQSPKFRACLLKVFNSPVSQLDDIHDHLNILHIGIRSIVSLKEKDLILLRYNLFQKLSFIDNTCGTFIITSFMQHTEILYLYGFYILFIC